jgi:undecaprenyl-diphosphatase
MMAVLVVFFKDWWNLFIGAIKAVKDKKQSTNGKMFWYLVVATIPAAIAGFLLDDIIDGVIRNNIWIITIALAIMGMLIYLGDKWAKKHYKKEIKFEDISLKQAFLVGVSQAFAVIPGFSRSGTTILAGRLMGISKEAITKFTFLLSVPIICGATILKVGDLAFTKEVIIGIISSFAMGIIAIKFLLNYIKKHDFSVFAFYRVILALIILVKLIFF